MELPYKTAAQLHQEEELQKQNALAASQNSTLVSNLASYFNKRWMYAKDAKRPIAKRMRENLRQRQGVYEQEKLFKIRQQGGSEIFANITNVKCRAAVAWLRDALLGDGNNKPWGIQPSRCPELPPDLAADANEDAQKEMALMLQAEQPVSQEDALEITRKALLVAKNEMMDLARREAELTEMEIESVLEDGGFHDAFADVLDDLVTYPAACLKGPIIRKRLDLAWQQDQETGSWNGVPQEKVVTEYERVSPFDLYPAPWATDIDNGYMIQRHRLTRSDIVAMLGMPGYDENAVRAVLKQHDDGGLSSWLNLGIWGEDTTLPVHQDIKTPYYTSYRTELIDALELWDSIPGRLLLEWGIPPESIPDPDKEYSANVWKIGVYIIKATLNYDPLGRKPYNKTSYDRVPGSFWGQGIPDLIKDPQDTANAALRALQNNMAIASGPQVALNVERLPEGAKVSSLHPWKIWQFVSDPIGSTAPAVDFFTPPSNAQELMNIFAEASNLADEYSGIPKYMMGDGSGGSARTASGLSMLIGNASKLIKSVTSNIDRMVEGVIQKTHVHLITQMGRNDLMGDINIVVRGADAILQKDNLTLRRTEFLAATANPIDMQIVGMEGRAAILKEQAKLLGMDADEIVKDPDVLKLEQMMQAQQAVQQAMAQQQPQGKAPTETTPGMEPALAKEGGRPAVSAFDQVPRT